MIWVELIALKGVFAPEFMITYGDRSRYTILNDSRGRSPRRREFRGNVISYIRDHVTYELDAQGRSPVILRWGIGRPCVGRTLGFYDGAGCDAVPIIMNALKELESYLD